VSSGWSLVSCSQALNIPSEGGTCPESETTKEDTHAPTYMHTCTQEPATTLSPTLLHQGPSCRVPSRKIRCCAGTGQPPTAVY
jgi:hypothetical protein